MIKNILSRSQIRNHALWLLAALCLVITPNSSANSAEPSAAPPASIKLVGRTRFLQTPRFGVWQRSEAFYTRAAGVELMSLDAETTTSDKDDIAILRLSANNGADWSPFKTITTATKTSQGTYRRWFFPGFVDPEKDILLFISTQGTLPHDLIIPESMTHLGLHHSLSRDGGRTWYHEGPIMQQGAGYDAEHSFPGVQVGKNTIMIGASPCFPLKLSSGEILIPVQICPQGPDGKYQNLGGGYTYHNAAVVRGRWTKEDRLEWELSQQVAGDPQQTTRGLFEPTLAEFSAGRVLMVMRGSKDNKPKLPAYRWYAISQDSGKTWGQAQPWTYTDGTRFVSPSACSQLLRHSNGRTYWIGNITPQAIETAEGNEPRYPLVIGEVDPESLLLRKETICVIEDREPKDPVRLQHSNFFAREERETQQIVVHLSPLGRGDEPLDKSGQPKIDRNVGLDWTGSAYLYRIEVPAKK